MAPANIYLVKMTDSAVTGGDGNVFELHVHVVFGCESKENSSVFMPDTAVKDPGVESGTEECENGKIPSISFPRYTCPDVISSVTTWF